MSRYVSAFKDNFHLVCEPGAPSPCIPALAEIWPMFLIPSALNLDPELFSSSGRTHPPRLILQFCCKTTHISAPCCSQPQLVLPVEWLLIVNMPAEGFKCDSRHGKHGSLERDLKACATFYQPSQQYIADLVGILICRQQFSDYAVSVSKNTSLYSFIRLGRRGIFPLKP